MWKRIAAVLVSGLVVGCSSANRTYSVSLKNDSPRPVTIALTKSGPPVEDAWASPEDIREGRSKQSAAHSITPVGAGHKADISNVAGNFPAGTSAVLRVYDGDLTFGEMIKTPPGRARVDVILSPGQNTLRVTEQPSGLKVEPAGKP